MLPATPDGEASFEVLQVEAPQTLVLGGVYDIVSERQVRFAAPKPERYWQATWAFVLHPLDARTTRLTVRARVAFAPAAVGLRTLWMAPIHHFMEAEQLRNLKRRAEGRVRHAEDTWQDVGSGIVGALGMLFDLATPFLRGVRNRWGLDAETSGFDYPGDEHIPAAKWQWTHGIEIDARAAEVWDWVAQIGAGRASIRRCRRCASSRSRRAAGCSRSAAALPTSRTTSPPRGCSTSRRCRPRAAASSAAFASGTPRRRSAADECSDRI
jgi:hypothetical protein